MSGQKKKTGLALKIILPLLILVIGFAAFNIMGRLKKEPQRQQPPQQGILADVIELKSTQHQVIVHATGTVSAEQEISLVPQVSGKISWISPRLVGGGFFKAGETLLKIEAADYQLAVEQARADVAGAQVSLATEQEQARVAMAEWDRLKRPDMGQPGPLVTREIQLKQQQAKLSAAQANLRKAQLNLQRTEITAPFNGRIRSEQVDLGQYLVAGGTIGSFAGTDRAEIHIPLADTELRWLQIPQTGAKQGSAATIRRPDDKETGWQGKIVRTLGEIDPDSRMATVVVSVEDPYQLKGTRHLPALPNGQFVDVELLGRQLSDTISIPRKALRNDNQVWIADSDNRLQLRPVDILRREQQRILLKGGVKTGEKLILTNISGAAEGTLLRPTVQENRQ